MEHALTEAHRALLQQFRGSMNLVGPGPIDVHFDDCNAALEGLDPRGQWVDLGSGAGFPGLVLAARHPELELDLVDSRRKRCWFLRQVLARAGVPASRVRVIEGRVEDLTGPYDGIVSRAFAPPPVVIGHALRLLAPGGRLVLFLQDEAPLPDTGGLKIASDNAYEVHGKRRRAVVLSH